MMRTSIGGTSFPLESDQAFIANLDAKTPHLSVWGAWPTTHAHDVGPIGHQPW